MATGRHEKSPSWITGSTAGRGWYMSAAITIRDKSIENRECDSTPTYGRYKNVFLRDEELTELPTLWQTYIDRLSEYMASTGKRHQNRAATIRRWTAEDRKKATPPARNRDYSVKVLI